MDLETDSEDDFTPIQPYRMTFEGKSWEAANIDMKFNGKWMIFYDKRTKKPLNEPPPISAEDKTPRRYYQRKGYVQPPKEIPEFQTPHDNYTAFRVRKRYAVTPYDPNRSGRYEYQDSSNLIDSPKLVNSHRFTGDNPYKNPFRKSMLLINEQRQKEAQAYITSQQQKRAPKIPKKKLPSLFERSIQRDKRFEL